MLCYSSLLFAFVGLSWGKSLYKLRQDDTGRVEFIYFDEIGKIEMEKERIETLYIRGY